MDALETLLRPVARLLNKSIAESTPARELCASLDGTVAAIRVRGTSLVAYFLIHADSVELTPDTNQEPDLAISGSLLTLARVASGGNMQAVRDGSLELIGDAEQAGELQRLLRYARPDFEEELATIIGDSAAHALGNLARGAGRWARDARSTMSSNVREYLQEESRDVPTRYEVERFSERVGTLRDDVERAAARIAQLQANRSRDND
jgi:ubiquinone biosynthesis protein UbiJ